MLNMLLCQSITALAGTWFKASEWVHSRRSKTGACNDVNMIQVLLSPYQDLKVGDGLSQFCRKPIVFYSFLMFSHDLICFLSPVVFLGTPHRAPWLPWTSPWKQPILDEACEVVAFTPVDINRHIWWWNRERWKFHQNHHTKHQESKLYHVSLTLTNETDQRNIPTNETFGYHIKVICHYKINIDYIKSYTDTHTVSITSTKRSSLSTDGKAEIHPHSDFEASLWLKAIYSQS